MKSEVIKARPESSSHYVDKNFVGYIRQGDVNIISTEASRAFVDNDTVEWDCQNYVLDLLDILEEHFIMDPEGEEYQTSVPGGEAAILYLKVSLGHP